MQIITKVLLQEKLLLGLSAEVNCEIPLNRYSCFEALEDKLLPNTKIELNIEFDNDKNLIWRQGAADAAGTSYRLQSIYFTRDLKLRN